jgi:hypothetical protein
MPAALPADVAAKLPPGTLQVRARDAVHLDRFRELYVSIRKSCGRVAGAYYSSR